MDESGDCMENNEKWCLCRTGWIVWTKWEMADSDDYVENGGKW